LRGDQLRSSTSAVCPRKTQKGLGEKMGTAELGEAEAEIGMENMAWVVHLQEFRKG
jgi:hypothetical protein